MLLPGTVVKTYLEMGKCYEAAWAGRFRPERPHGVLLHRASLATAA